MRLHNALPPRFIMGFVVAFILGLLSGCESISHLVRATPTLITSDQLIVKADVIRATDYWIDIACGTHREEIQSSCYVSYARTANNQLRPLRITGKGPSDEAAYFDWRSIGVDELNGPEITGSNDPAWQAAISNATAFIKRVNPEQAQPEQARFWDGQAQAIVVTADRNWIVVMPHTTQSGVLIFTFSGEEFRCGESAIVFGRSFPQGRGFANETFGLRPHDTLLPSGIASTGGILEFYFNDFSQQQHLIVQPVSGHIASLKMRRLSPMPNGAWNPQAGTMVFSSYGEGDGPFDVVEWHYRDDRCVHIRGDLRDLFERRNDALVPRNLR